MGFLLPVLKRKSVQSNYQGIWRNIFVFCLTLFLLMNSFGFANASSLPEEKDKNNHPSIITIGDSPSGGAAAWGDYNNDGYADLIVSGLNGEGQKVTTLYRQFPCRSRLTDTGIAFPGLEGSSVDWGDYDQDGYLDLVLTGMQKIQDLKIVGFTGIYHNVDDGHGKRTFVLALNLPGVYDGTARWGDFDRDGKPDILLTGIGDDGMPLTRIYKNNGGGNFAEAALSGSPLEGLGYSAAAWGDYDRDGALDFAIIGKNVNEERRTLIYHNNGNSGFDAPVSLLGAWGGTVNWIDVDNDGDYDLFVTGNTGEDNDSDIAPITRMYLYQPGDVNMPFINASSLTISGMWQSSVDVGDFDNDGWPDLIINGNTYNDRISSIFINDKKGSFLKDNDVDFPVGSGIKVSFVNFTRDNTLDASLVGVPTADLSGYLTKIYFNHFAEVTNATPSAPVLKMACVLDNHQVRFDWQPSQDDHTPVQALTYNFALGREADNLVWIYPSADLNSGKPRKPGPGNAQAEHFFAVLPDWAFQAAVEWGAQALDSSYAGSVFSSGIADLTQTVANADQFDLEENTAKILDLVSNDQAAEGEVKIYDYSQPQHGTLQIGSDNKTLTYQPNDGWFGADQFTYLAVDASNHCSQASVNLNVQEGNHPPVGLSLSNDQVYEGSADLLVGQFTTDDPDHEPAENFSYTLVSQDGVEDQNDLFRIEGDRLYTRVALDHTQSRQRIVHVRTTDTRGGSFEETFPITILVTPPTVYRETENGGQEVGATSDISIDRNTTLQLTLFAVDPGASEPLTWSIAEAPEHGAAVAEGTSMSAQPFNGIRYTPEKDWMGADQFVVRVTDPYQNWNEIRILVIVEGTSNPPSFDPIPDQVFDENSGVHEIPIQNIQPGDGQNLSFTWTADPPGAPIGPIQIEYPVSNDPTKANLRITVGAGSANIQFTLTLDNGETIDHLAQQKFLITVRSKDQSHPVFLPLILNSP